jgi:ferredoxin--NADP+ reductase
MPRSTMMVGVNATLVHRIDLSGRVALLRIRPDAQPLSPFIPGQFVQIGLPMEMPSRDGTSPPRVRILKRSYSIASDPGEAGEYELCVALVQGGKLTPELWKLPVGGKLWVDEKPMGHFTLVGIPAEKTLLCISTGTGLAPFVSMLRESRRTGSARRFIILHGVRECADLCYREELEQRRKLEFSTTYIPVVSREEWPGLRGRLQSVLEDEGLRRKFGIELDPARTHALLCGNPDMIVEVRALLEAHGFRVDTAAGQADCGLGGIRLERYW